jgi:hypothetical protein
MTGLARLCCRLAAVALAAGGMPSALAQEAAPSRFTVTLSPLTFGDGETNRRLELGYTAWRGESGTLSFGPTLSLDPEGRFPLTPPEPAPALSQPIRRLGLQGRASLDLGRDWALVGVIGYRRVHATPDGTAAVGASTVYSFFGFDLRF